MDFRIGSSVDTHKLITQPNSTIKLGGVKFASDFNIEAISDGDVVLHSVSEAIFGALGLGDLGDWFPEETANKGLDSKLILEVALKQLEMKKAKIVNIDLLITLEGFILGEKKSQIKNSLVKLIGCENINVKATRGKESDNKYITCLATILVFFDS